MDAQNPDDARRHERLLVVRAQGGDADAFSELILKRTPGVLAFLRRMLGDAEDARDVAQLTFVRVWENLHRYDSAWAFSTWLFRIAGNLAIDALRSRRTRSRTEAENFRLLQGGGAKTQPEGPLDLERQEVRRIFDACALVLSEKQRLVFVLREFEEKESREIAEILDCRESTVRNHLFQARRLLRAEITRLYPEFVPGTRRAHPETEDRKS
ncbi:MAG: sigma-70 family RNA polymerase sigma factor [Thermoanaerobaculia bacterium]